MAIRSDAAATNQAPGGVLDLVRIAYNDPNVDWHNFDLDRGLASR